MIKLEITNPTVEQFLNLESQPTKDQLRKVLEVPRQDLIYELECVLTQILKHHSNDNEPTFTPLHCLFLLTELQSESSLPLLLQLCKLDDDSLFFYFDDHTTETMWQDTFVLGKNNLNELFNFLIDSDSQSIGTCIITDGLTQIGLHFPELRLEIINGLKNTYKYLYENKRDYKIDHLDWLLMVAIDLNAVELLATLKLFFDNNRMLDYKKWDDFVDEFGPNFEGARPLQSIVERYENDATPDIQFEREFFEINSMNPDTLEELEIMENRIDELMKRKGISMPTINNKIGRNELCPCGSGKKYKNCCIDN